MFTYWPFVSLVVMGVMVTILLLLKFADKICRARMTPTEGFVERQYEDDQVHPLEMLEDGAGTMMDFNLQDSGSVRSQRTLNSQVGYSPASETGPPGSGYGGREFAL